MGMTLMVLLCVALVVGTAVGMWLLNLHIARRARAEEALRHARDELADRVRERTADLEQANWRLQAEIAERQHAQEQARQRQEQLAHVGRISTLGEMAAGLAHELNQPLGAIASFTEGCTRLIEAGEADLDELHEMLEETSQQAKRAGRIIHRLRAFFAKEPPQRAPAEVRQLTMEVVDLLAMDLRQEQIEFNLEVPPDLPPVLADRIQMQQVLLNLMRNAVEGMAQVPADGRRLSVCARAGTGGMVEILVSDTGPGCDPDTLAKMFDAFYTTKASGIGMGLSISRSIIEAHGGKLWAAHNDDGGLTFRFALPAAEGEDHATEPKQ
jgi:two-component system sensor histidine kinase TtrS